MELRCAPWAEAERVDPIGTAGSYRGFCCVEWPLPWPRDMADVPELGTLAAEVAGRGIRLQGLVPVPGATRARVLLYERPHLGFVAYLGSEVECAPADVVAAAHALLDGRAGSRVPSGTTEVLICGHGRRDVCCGSRGVALAAGLDGLLGPDVRVWRTSHTGGHRFAATGIVLPEGTLWAWLDRDLLARIVGRRGPATEVLAFYRGCAGLGSPAVQALERAVLAHVGWEVLDCERRGTDVDGGRTRLDVRWPDGTARAWEGQVEVGRVLPVPDCGEPLSAAKKIEVELAVTVFEAVSPT